MARKSRIGECQDKMAPVSNALYKTGMYARLSSEGSGADCLENQILLLKEFAEAQLDMSCEDVYKDFGYTGTNFERPGFERLMEDAKRGRINCIVVKDLSRLGRDYIETGNLIENIFPFLNVRLVSVTDGFDTLSGGGMESMVASIKNLVNDVYSKDISRKIITAFRTKQRNGDYIGMVAPYGYLKSEENKNKFVVDSATAPVVCRIFESYAEGMGLDAIVRMLDGESIDCPRKYRHRIGITKSERYLEARWCRSAVKTILTNRAYIGDIVQGKVKQELCNGLQKQYMDSGDWIVVEGTHEPVVGKEIFFRVQELFGKRCEDQRQKRAKSQIKGHKEENYLKGYLRCGCCGKGFNLSQNMRSGKITRQYYCQGYQTLRTAICTNKDRIAKKDMDRFVLEQIKDCIRKILKEGVPNLETEGNRDAEGIRIIRIDRELKALSGKLADLYQDVNEGILDDTDYLMMKKEFQRRREILELEKKHLINEVEKKQKRMQGMPPQDKLKKCLSVKKLNRVMVECFVKEVRILGGGRLEADLLECGEILYRLEG